MSEAAQRLAALAAGLCQDAGISIEVREGAWAWDPVRQVLQVDARDLATLGPEACAGVLSVEIGRFFVSRHRLFELDFPSEKAGRILLDALDTRRASRWIRTRYAGVGPWIDQITVTPPQADLPPFLQLCIALNAGGLRDLHPEATAVLRRIRDAARAHARTLPSEDLDNQWDRQLAGTYREVVQPHVPDTRWLPSPAEQRIQLSATYAQFLAEDDILPAAAELLKRELHAVAQYLSDHPTAAMAARKALAGGDAAKLICQATCSAPDGHRVSAWVLDLATDLYERALDDVAPRAVVQHARYRPGSDGQRVGRELPDLPPLTYQPKPPTNYDAARRQVASQIEDLVRHLGEILRPRKRLRTRAGYPSGRRVDLSKLMQFEADPRRYDALWVRSTIPDRREVSVLLLVDLSGSMSGEKARCAVLGSILLAETLHRLKTPFAIYGFQDVLIPFCDFGQGMGDATQAAISEMSQEVEGDRSGGNNNPAYNDDAPCLREAADLLLQQSTTDRVLLIVSDGMPAGCRSSEDDLHRVVEELSRPDSGLDLIALGLGPDTEHVERFYEDAEANVPVDQFAAKIGAVTERVLLRSR